MSRWWVHDELMVGMVLRTCHGTAANAAESESSRFFTREHHDLQGPVRLEALYAAADNACNSRPDPECNSRPVRLKAQMAAAASVRKRHHQVSIPGLRLRNGFKPSCFFMQLSFSDARQ